MDDRAAEIIPQLLPEAELVIEQNVEIKRELLRADLVYLIQYKGDPHILNLELQTGSDSKMAQRVLLYHVDLHLEYQLPVISVVLYLFETSVPEPPYRETSGDEEPIDTTLSCARSLDTRCTGDSTEACNRYVYIFACHERRKCFATQTGN